MKIPNKSETDIILAISRFERSITAAGLPKPRLEAEWLLAQAIGVSRTGLYMESGIPSNKLELADSWLRKRLEGEPLQYLFGSVDFCGIELEVANGVFIPRPETEMVAEQAVGFLRERQSKLGNNLSILDLGTGSANLSIAVAREFRSCLVVAVDISLEALCIASRNISRNGFSNQIALVQSDWDEAIRAEFDLVVSNPPYVASRDIESMPFGSEGDPILSLDGGEDGMDFYRRLSKAAEGLLKPGAGLCLECAEDQAEMLFNSYSILDWVGSVSVFKDLNNRLRGMIVRRK